jgi:hypothetical protein
VAKGQSSINDSGCQGLWGNFYPGVTVKGNRYLRNITQLGSYFVTMSTMTPAAREFVPFVTNFPATPCGIPFPR